MLTVTLGLKVSKFFKSEQVEVHSSFLEPVDLEFVVYLICCLIPIALSA